MDLLENVIQEYAWGSHRAIAELLGRPSPAERPQAELWMGAHPGGPSRVLRGGGELSLLELIERAPREELGDRVVEGFGPRLPFLLKVLAAELPLSLQAHPSAEQARRGFEREEAMGLARSAPSRNYKDKSHKPELLCALTDFEALCGFRSVPQTQRLLEALAVKELAPFIQLLEQHPDARGVEAVFGGLMRLGGEARTRLVTATLAACRRLSQTGQVFASECGWAVKLGGLNPGDVGAVSALLLNLVTLRPGQAIFLPAGNLHAYLHGVGIEIMANSDNVLRGGLTPKHVDVAELLSVVDFHAGPVMPLFAQADAEGALRYLTPASEFGLFRIVLAGTRRYRGSPQGPEILLCTEGRLVLHGGSVELPLPKGASAWISASDKGYELSGEGTAFRAEVGFSARVGVERLPGG